MKKLVKLTLVIAFLFTSCSASKVSQIDNQYLQNHWIHLYEEDENSVKVFRPSDYSFKPSRGREEIVINAEGILRFKPISPDDEHVFFDGTWKVEGATLELNYDHKTEVFKIIEVDSSILKLK